MNRGRNAPGAGCHQSEGQRGNDRAKYTEIARRVNASPRLRRAVLALIGGPVGRSDLDAAIGTTNAPHYVATLKALGLVIVCESVKTRDRDGAACRYGRYHLGQPDRKGLRRDVRP